MKRRESVSGYIDRIAEDPETLREFVDGMEIALCAHGANEVETDVIHGWMRRLKEWIDDTANGEVPIA